ncbi:MAG: hypothetical protein ACRDRL_03295 [Sciscionella sp.]
MSKQGLDIAAITGRSIPVRHAAARQVTVVVYLYDDLVLDITDDGVGLVATAKRSGLRNLAQRAAQAGGTFTVARPEHGGTHLHWSAHSHNWQYLVRQDPSQRLTSTPLRTHGRVPHNNCDSRVSWVLGVGERGVAADVLADPG